MDRTHWIRLLPWLMALSFLPLFFVQPAAADVTPAEVQSYERDFGVSQATAETNLDIQEQGAGIVGQLRAAMGDSYAGVWFDNESGEFVVPLVSDTDRAAINSELSETGVKGAFRVVEVEATWEDLETVQDQLDKQLSDLIRSQQVQTSLDPAINAVVLYVADSVDKSNRDAIGRLARASDSRVAVKYEEANLLRAAPLACRNVAEERSCGKPLRGGVLIYPPEGGPPCSTAFKAVGNVNSNRFMLTAGHCAPVGANRTSYDEVPSSHYVGLTEQSSFPGADYAKIRVNGYGKWWEEGLSSWPSMIAYWGVDHERQISAESYSYLGEYVCHAGIASGSSCGNVAALHKTISYPAGPVYNLSEVKGGGFCAIPGDSGGPVFAGNTALGIFSGALVASCGGNLGYYVEITEATNALGVSVGPRLGIAPTVFTDPPTDVQELQATLNGTIDPHWSQTSYHFEYGPTTAYGSSIPSPDGSAGAASQVSANATLTNLQPGTTYHYRLVASNASGTRYGIDRQFVTTSAPAAVNTGTAINVYSRAASGALYQKWCCSGAEGWSSWWHMGSPLEQGITSGPATVMHSTNLNVYARAANGRLYQKWCCSGAEGWSSWWDMGSPPAGEVTSSAAAVMHNGNLNVYVRGGDGHLYQKWCCSGAEGWSSWWDMGSPPGGGITSAPAAVDAGGGVVNVYARGANGRLYQKWCCGTEGWSNWWDMGSPPGGGITSSPAAVNTGSAVNVYVSAADGHLYQKWCCSGAEGWSSWWDMGNPPPGKITAGPAAVNAGGGVINVYARTVNDHVYQKWCCSGAEGWSTWWDMGSPP